MRSIQLADVSWALPCILASGACVLDWDKGTRGPVDSDAGTKAPTGETDAGQDGAVSCDLAVCGEHASCTSSGGRASCTCDSGYLGDGGTCTRDPVCVDLGCDANATCEAGACACARGFEGDGLTCTDIDDCKPDTCLNDGVCVDLKEGTRCECDTTKFAGDRCELKLCGDITIGTAAELAAAAVCKEIRGNLKITGSDSVHGVEATDLPALESVTGDVIIQGLKPRPGESSHTYSIELPALRTIGERLVIGGASQSGSEVVNVKSVRFPVLQRIGNGSASGDYLALDVVYLSGLELSFPALTRIGGAVRLFVTQVCSADFHMVVEVTGPLTIAGTLAVPASAVQPLRNASLLNENVMELGCCSASDYYMCTKMEDAASDLCQCAPTSG